jgi:hypothetical protein
VIPAISERASAADLSEIAPPYGLERLLGEFESLLRLIPAAAYNAAQGSGEATIARHVGRCLDLIETLLSARAVRVIVYGPRDSGVAGDLMASLRRVEELQNLLINWPAWSLDAGPCAWSSRSGHWVSTTEDGQRRGTSLRSSSITSWTGRRSSNAR